VLGMVMEKKQCNDQDSVGVSSVLLDGTIINIPATASTSGFSVAPMPKGAIHG